MLAQNQTATLTIPVRVTTPENKVLTSTLITKVQVTIKGRYGLLRQFSDERPKGLDIALTGDEQEQFTFDPKSIELPPELTVVSITPPVMLVPLFILAVGALFAGVVFHDHETVAHAAALA